MFVCYFTQCKAALGPLKGAIQMLSIIIIIIIILYVAWWKEYEGRGSVRACRVSEFYAEKSLPVTEQQLMNSLLLTISIIFELFSYS